jgi:hypothetical protein
MDSACLWCLAVSKIDPDEKLTFYYRGATGARVVDVVTESIRERGHDLVDVYDEFLIDVYLMLDKPGSKHVAIDWDNTISADQGYFRQLILKLQKAGYSPFVCTLRAPDKENIAEMVSVLEEAEIPIYLTDGKRKRKYLKKLGLKVHLWIDDFYPAICGDACRLLKRNKIE